METERIPVKGSSISCLELGVNAHSFLVWSLWDRATGRGASEKLSSTATRLLLLLCRSAVTVVRLGSGCPS